MLTNTQPWEDIGCGEKKTTLKWLLHHYTYSHLVSFTILSSRDT